jgi:hypothetical protein
MNSNFETVIIDVGDDKIYADLRREGYNCIASGDGVIWMRRLVTWQKYDSDYLDSAEYHEKLISY